MHQCTYWFMMNREPLKRDQTKNRIDRSMELLSQLGLVKEIIRVDLPIASPRYRLYRKACMSLSLSLTH